MNNFTPQDFVIVLGAIGLFLTTIGGAIRYVLVRMDRKTKEAEDRAEDARKEMRKHLEEEIDTLRGTVSLLSARENLYLKRVLQLEAFIQGQKGWAMPTLEGWPPK